MSNLINYKGVEVDLDKLNYIKAVDKKMPNSEIIIPGISFVGESGATKTRYGQDFEFSSRKGVVSNIFHETSAPYAYLREYFVNLQKIKSVNVNFEGEGEKDSTVNVEVSFKDDSSVKVVGESDNMCYFTLPEFCNSLQCCNNEYNDERMIDKDNNGVAFDISVVVDKSATKVENGEKTWGEYCYGNIKSYETNFIDGIKVKEVPVETLGDNVESPSSENTSDFIALE